MWHTFLSMVSCFQSYPDFADKTFTFNIDVIGGETEAAALDERIGITIVEVFKLFFRKIENVVVYVCDMTDERHLARKRKFDLWFWKYNDGNIIKEDGIAVIEDTEIYNSLLVHKNNPHLATIILAFKELNEKADDK
jgi:hypothetical protein